jgi:hypothetical protein
MSQKFLKISRMAFARNFVGTQIILKANCGCKTKKEFRENAKKKHFNFNPNV